MPLLNEGCVLLQGQLEVDVVSSLRTDAPHYLDFSPGVGGFDRLPHPSDRVHGVPQRRRSGLGPGREEEEEGDEERGAWGLSRDIASI